MKVISYTDPIIVDGVRINQPSDYLSADGEDFYNARGRRMKRLGKIGRRFGKVLKKHPTVALARAFKSRVSFDGSDYYDFDGDSFSYIDQKNTNEVKAFQEYVLKIKKDSTILGNAGADGIWGNNTAKAYEKYGADYEEYLKKAKALFGKVTGIVPNAPLPTTTTSSSTTTTTTTVENQSDGKSTTKDGKKMNMKKIAIYGGIGVVVLIIAVALLKKK